MNLLTKFGIYAEYILDFLFILFLLVGSITACKSKVSLATVFMTIFALIAIASILFITYITYSYYEFSGITASMPEEFKKMDQFHEYNRICYIIRNFSLIFFSVAFALFCCQIANIRKRNEQLEFLNQELSQR